MTDPLTAHDVVSRLLPEKLDPARFFEAYAPSNIALSKYWGKRNKPLNLPLNSSLSVSLADLGSQTQVMPASDEQDRVWLNGDLLAPDSPFARKVVDFANLFRRGQPQPLHIKTTNTISTAAGLASSASGFAALTKALVGSFGLELPDAQQSMIARLGSGSATRSFWHGFVRWDRGDLDDGSDSFARPLNHPWPEFRIAIIPVDTGPKAHSSRDGMQHTVSTSPLYAPWPERAEADCFEIEQAVAAQDFVRCNPTAGQCWTGCGPLGGRVCLPTQPWMPAQISS